MSVRERARGGHVVPIGREELQRLRVGPRERAGKGPHQRDRDGVARSADAEVTRRRLDQLQRRRGTLVEDPVRAARRLGVGGDRRREPREIVDRQEWKEGTPRAWHGREPPLEEEPQELGGADELGRFTGARVSHERGGIQHRPRDAQAVGLRDERVVLGALRALVDTATSASGRECDAVPGDEDEPAKAGEGRGPPEHLEAALDVGAGSDVRCEAPLVTRGEVVDVHDVADGVGVRRERAEEIVLHERQERRVPTLVRHPAPVGISAPRRVAHGRNHRTPACRQHRDEPAPEEPRGAGHERRAM